MVAKISTLPIEIIQFAISSLEPNDLFSLRLVSRQFNTLTLSQFGKNFETVQVDLSPRKKLHVEISNFHDPGSGAKFDLSRFTLYGKATSEAMNVVLFILAETPVPITALTVKSKFPLRHVGEVDDSPLPLFNISTYVAVCARLEELVFEYGISSSQSRWILTCISHTRRLRKLSLTFVHKKDSFLDRLGSITSLEALEELNRRNARLTRRGFFELIYRNRNTLRTISVANSNLQLCTWAALFSGMHGKFPHLEDFAISFVIEDDDHIIIFPGLEETPVVPGTIGEVKVCDGIAYRSRLIAPTGLAVDLEYLSGENIVFGFHGRGLGMDDLLALLSRTAQRF
ncbi:MAG: hypothetical protein Q9170_006095 [Blastenia crenularia]